VPTPDINDFDPMYISQTVNRAPRDLITSDRWNELWNLIIEQGDYNSEALDLLCNAFTALVDFSVPDNSLTTAKMATEQKRGVANGVASLDGSGYVPLTELGNIDIAQIATNTADIAALSGGAPATVLTTQGDLLYFDGTSLKRLPKSNAYKGLSMNAAATAPEWQPTSKSVLTAEGDTLYASGANTLARLGKGTAGQVLQMNSGATAPEWATKEIEFNVVTGSDYATSIPNGGGTISIPLGLTAPKIVTYTLSGKDDNWIHGMCGSSSRAKFMTKYKSGASGTPYSSHMQSGEDSIGSSITDGACFNVDYNGSFSITSITINGTNLDIVFSNWSGHPRVLYIAWELGVIG
jgi:hypothetical protein